MNTRTRGVPTKREILASSLSASPPYLRARQREKGRRKLTFPRVAELDFLIKGMRDFVFLGVVSRRWMQLFKLHRIACIRRRVNRGKERTEKSIANEGKERKKEKREERGSR